MASCTWARSSGSQSCWILYVFSLTHTELQVFGVTNDPYPGLDGHVFPNPVDPSSYVAMLVHKNGSLSREGTHYGH